MKNKFLAGLLVAGVFVGLAYAAATHFTNVVVDQTLTVTGQSNFTGAIVSTNTITAKRLALGEAVNVAVSTPTVLWQIVRTSAGVVYIATGTTTPSQWSKIGAQ